MEAIVIYGTPWCADCIKAKSILDSLNVKYKFINIDRDDQAAAKVMEINGGRRVVPVLIIGGIAYTNPWQQELRDLIEPFVIRKASCPE